jgi:hypothetical protein
MPLNEPAPLVGTAEQAAPKGIPIALAVVEDVDDELADPDEVVAAALEGAAAADVVPVLEVEPHAARPIGSAARRATKAVVRRAFM